MFALLTSWSHYTVFSQSDSLSQYSKIISSGKDSITHVHSLYSSIGSGLNMIFLGSTISLDKPLYSATVTYGFRNSFYASASATHIVGVIPYMAFCNLSLSYSHVFNSWFDISSGISGYHTPESLKDKLFGDFAYINVTAGFDWKFIYTKLSFGELISDGTREYLQVRNSRYFETPVFLKGKGQISFDPSINVLFGDLLNVETSTGFTRLGSWSVFHHIRKYPVSTIYSYSYKFGLLDFEFSLPVTFSYGNFSLDAEPGYILPSFSNSDYPAPKGFTFFLTANFKII
jgi:hypothetical protein